MTTRFSSPGEGLPPELPLCLRGGRPHNNDSGPGNFSSFVNSHIFSVFSKYYHSKQHQGDDEKKFSHLCLSTFVLSTRLVGVRRIGRRWKWLKTLARCSISPVFVEHPIINSFVVDHPIFIPLSLFIFCSNLPSPSLTSGKPPSIIILKPMM